MEKRLIYFVGDKPSDVQAAEAIGMRAYPFEEENFNDIPNTYLRLGRRQKIVGFVN